MPSGRFSQRQRLSRTSPDSQTCRQYLQAGQYAHLRRCLHGSTRKLRRSLFRRTPELRDCLHEAICQRNFGLLKVLVNYCEAHMEARNKEGLTPLYHAVSRRWVHGALFLLCRGANVHHAERSLSNASCRYPPLVHAVVATGSTTLLKEVIRRGADINVTCLGGENCLDAQPRIPEDMLLYIEEEMKKANPLQEENIQDVQRMQQQAGISSRYTMNESILVESLLANQYSQDTIERTQLLGAWHVTKGDYTSALHCWQYLWQSHGSDVEGSMAYDVFWAEILGVNNHRLLVLRNFDSYDHDMYDTFALLVIAKYAPADKQLVYQISRVLRELIIQDDLFLCIHVMERLTAERVLSKPGLSELAILLSKVLRRLMYRSEVPFSVLFDAVMITSRCLSLLATDSSFSTDSDLTTRHDLSSGYDSCRICTLRALILQNLLHTMCFIYKRRVSPSEEHYPCCFNYIKDFVCMFPRIRGENLFHFIQHEHSSSLFTAPSIKTLVTLSAEARGTNRHENSPPHLSSDKNGNTPLHVFAGRLSGEDLMEEGVLQCFLDHGAHLCSRNREGVSVQNILVKRGLFTEGELLPSLQCLAAAAFMKDANLREKVHNVRPNKVRHILLDH